MYNEHPIDARSFRYTRTNMTPQIRGCLWIAGGCATPLWTYNVATERCRRICVPRAVHDVSPPVPPLYGPRALMTPSTKFQLTATYQCVSNACTPGISKSQTKTYRKHILAFIFSDYEFIIHAMQRAESLSYIRDHRSSSSREGRKRNHTASYTGTRSESENV